MGLQDKINETKKYLETLDNLRLEFPDLDRFCHRWGEVLVSKMANDKVDKFYTKNSCGCCEDAFIDVWFYTERNGEKVYSNPPMIAVGRKGCKWDKDWKKRVKEEISKTAFSLLNHQNGGKGW